MLKTLDALGHRVTALAIRRAGENGLTYFDGATVDLRLFDQPSGRPLLERKLRSLWRSGWELAGSELGRAAQREAHREYDVILAEHPAAARSVEDDPRTVLSLHCLRYVDLARRSDGASTVSLRERIQARRAELSTSRRVRRIRAVSARLASVLRSEGVTCPIGVIPLCIDPALYAPQPAPPVPTVGVLGSMFWAPSRLAARHFVEVLVPRIRAEAGGVRFLVGGWQARRFLSDVVRDDDIDLLDNFAHPAAAFARLSVLVYAPPVGTGMKVKVLEAMAYGVPAVVNREGFEGLDVDPQPPVRLALTNDEIVHHVVDVLHDRRAREQAIDDGRRCIARSFSPLVVTQALVEWLKTIGTPAQPAYGSPPLWYASRG
jgi:glycosyltransferase involved in cell wall biosynthesis